MENKIEILIHFAQAHETFRKPEIEALAELGGFQVQFTDYALNSPFALATIQDEHHAMQLSRAILVKGLYELWGSGTTYGEVHSNLKKRLPVLWKTGYSTNSFKFDVDCYQGKRSYAEQRELVNSFSYLNLMGPVRMKNPDLTFSILEEYDEDTPAPNRIFMGRLLTPGSRAAIDRYDVKKRHYIGNTTMDAELSLITANFAHASPGKLIYDPFAGTGSFLITSSHFGALSFGSDIDGRALRGKNGRSVLSNFEKYGLLPGFGDTFISDLTNTPMRECPGVNRRVFDAIICDPPYGVREGLKVLGTKDPEKGKVPIIRNGALRHLQPDYIPPKRPYSFTSMMSDILDFAAMHLVAGGRLCMWMPTANEDLSPLTLPQHPQMELKAVCVQTFNKWSRQLLTYSRCPIHPDDDEVITKLRQAREKYQAEKAQLTADELNDFRRKYFQGFKQPES
ncbi:S-adenosyl-L-methionine-dependent methyltransferase [Kalaharituber pfeilii]|nr:S-adenosyl-L-methionine-dependent methyltransferase [Kalaharituber pfeilii]